MSASKKRLTIVSPYISCSQADFVVGKLHEAVDVYVLTCLREDSLNGGALQIGALQRLGNFSSGSKVIHLPRLHAKIYVADESQAIITSGNLTFSGIESNHEYGVGIGDPCVVRQVRQHIAYYAELGHAVTAEQLAALEEKVAAVREKAATTLREGGEEKELRHALRQLNDKCLNLHTPTSLFKKALLHLLCAGPQTTKELQEGIRSLYPELSASKENRVIREQNFGKKWKHDLRNAQQGLKKSSIAYDAATKKWSLR